MRLHCERFLNDMDVFRNCLVLVEMALIRLIYQLYLHWLYLQEVSQSLNMEIVQLQVNVGTGSCLEALGVKIDIAPAKARNY